MKEQTDWEKVALSAESKIIEVSEALSELKNDCSVTAEGRAIILGVYIKALKIIAKNIKEGVER